MQKFNRNHSEKTASDRGSLADVLRRMNYYTIRRRGVGNNFGNVVKGVEFEQDSLHEDY